MELLIQVLEEELLEPLKIIGLGLAEILVVLVSELNKLFWQFGLLTEKLFETMDQCLPIGRFQTQHDYKVAYFIKNYITYLFNLILIIKIDLIIKHLSLYNKKLFLMLLALVLPFSPNNSTDINRNDLNFFIFNEKLSY